MSIVMIIRILVALERIVQMIRDTVVERQKVEDLEKLKAAVSDLKEANSYEERHQAIVALRAANRKR